MSRLERDQIPFEDIIREAKINYENLEAVSYSKRITSNFQKIDTLAIFNFKWNDSLTTPEKEAKDLLKLKEWFKTKLDLDTLVVRSYN